jgi:CelD/BcsL family acetyltransferase involved in cellulose biosynthesis
MMPSAQASHARPPRVRIEELTTLAELEAIEHEWLRLWTDCPSSTPFQHPAWIRAWCRHFEPETPRFVVMRCGQKLVGLAPMLIYREGSRRIFGLLGGGVSDYLDVLFDAPANDLCTRLLLAYLTDTQSQWDQCRFEQLRPASPLLQLTATDFHQTRELQEVCPVLQLPQRIDQLSAHVSPGVLRDARYNWRRAQKLADFAVDFASEQNLESRLDAVRRLHQARWQSRQQPGMFAEAAVQRFHHEAAPSLQMAGILRVCTLRLGADVISAVYALAARKRVYHYLTGFDPAFEHLSPGKLVNLASIEHAIAQGDTHFDFLRGSEPYKHAWGAKDQPIYRLFLEPTTDCDSAVTPESAHDRTATRPV